jgi:hypothetical protein
MASLLSGKFQLFHRNFSFMEKLQNETAMYTRLVYIDTVGLLAMIESDVSQNVTQTLSTLIFLAMALILTPSLSLSHFCKSDNCGISKVTRHSDLICQILTLTL